MLICSCVASLFMPDWVSEAGCGWPDAPASLSDSRSVRGNWEHNVTPKPSESSSPHSKWAYTLPLSIAVWPACRLLGSSLQCKLQISQISTLALHADDLKMFSSLKTLTLIDDNFERYDFKIQRIRNQCSFFPSQSSFLFYFLLVL